MPAANIPLTGIEKTVSNRVITSVVRDFLQQTGLDKDTRLKIESTYGKHQTLGYNALEDNAIPQIKNLKIEYSETIDMENTATVATYQGEHRDFFTSTNPDIHIRPTYIDSKMDISLRFTSTSRDRINRWKNNILTYIARNTSFLVEDLTYMYLLPFHIYDLLNTIHSKLGNYTTLTDFYEWLGYHSDGRLVWGSDLTGTFRDIFVKERQSRVVVLWNIPVLEEMVKEFENGKWGIDFTLTVTYQKPISIHVLYPVLVCNSLLPEKYVLPVSVIRDTDRKKIDRDRLLDGLYLHEEQILVDMVSEKYLKYPWWDDVVVPKYHNDYAIAASILCTISEDDKRTLFSLDDIDPLVINSTIKDWLISGGNERVTKSYEAPIYIKLLENNRYIEDSVLELSTDLTLSATTDLEMCKIYRVVFFAIRNPCFIGSYHKAILEQDYPDLIGLYNEDRHKNYTRNIHGRWVDKPQYVPKNEFGCPVSVMKTVQTLSIFSYRRD